MIRPGLAGMAAAVALLVQGAAAAGHTPAPGGAPAVRRGAGNAASPTCQSRSRRYPWAKAALRTWTPRSATLPPDVSTIGTATGAPFTARLIQAYGEDYQQARRSVILEMADGCRRQYRVASFSDADQALIDREMARHPLIPDAASYALNVHRDIYTPDALRKGDIRVYQTQHFALWYGTNKQGDFYTTMAKQGRDVEQALRETGDWMERMWLINRDVLHAPLPYASSKDRRKIDIYLCGTGRKMPDNDDLIDCGASAWEGMNLSARVLNLEANTIVHEFGHVIQYYTGSFRDWATAGPIWETGAEWNAFEISPFMIAHGGSYFDFPEFGPLFSMARYGAHPFMSYLFEKDDTRPLVFDTWRHNRRDAKGASVEDYIPAFVHLARQRGIYPRGFRDFADDMGWYGARLVTMDFLKQRSLLDILNISRAAKVAQHFYTPLLSVEMPGEHAVFAPPAARNLLEFGTHIVPLTATAGRVTVTLTGGTTAHQAAWRFTLVAVDARGVATYAPMAAVTGQGHATVSTTPPKGSTLFLAVTATPGTYEPLGWHKEGKPVQGTRFPYRVAIDGATPAAGSVEACPSQMLAGGRPCVAS